MRDIINDLLSMAADMESCIPVGDSLTRMVNRYTDDELNEADLTFVAAAVSEPSYEAFCKSFQLDPGK